MDLLPSAFVTKFRVAIVRLTFGTTKPLLITSLKVIPACSQSESFTVSDFWFQFSLLRQLKKRLMEIENRTRPKKIVMMPPIELE